MADMFLMPQYILSGESAMENSSHILKTFGIKAFIVTDHLMVNLGNVIYLTEFLESHHINYYIYDEVNQEPTDLMVKAGVKKYEENDCDFLIGLGGGSSIDTMKAITILLQSNMQLLDLIDKEFEQQYISTVAIPTTAGTGSEVTKFAIISDSQSHFKMVLKGKGLIPSMSIIDPRFTLTVPPSVTAATGIDALTHAIEAYISKHAQPLSDTFAISAIKRIFNSLQNAYLFPNNINARIDMSLAALEAGIAFSNSSVALIHGMSRPLGVLFHIPHGLSNAILLEVCINYLSLTEKEKFVQLAKGCDWVNSECTIDEGIEIFKDQIHNLLKNLEIPTLTALNIDKKEYKRNIPKMAQDAFLSGSPSNNHELITTSKIEELYQMLLGDDE